MIYPTMLYLGKNNPLLIRLFMDIRMAFGATWKGDCLSTKGNPHWSIELFIGPFVIQFTRLWGSE